MAGSYGAREEGVEENRLGKQAPSDEKPRVLRKMFRISHEVMRRY